MQIKVSYITANEIMEILGIGRKGICNKTDNF